MLVRRAISISVVRPTFCSTRRTALCSHILNLHRETLHSSSRSNSTQASHAGESTSPTQSQDPASVDLDRSSAVPEDTVVGRDVILPDLPERISSLYISQSDFERYFGSLYLRGWGVYISSSATPSLLKTFRFPTDKALLEFLAELGQSIIEVQHHPTVRFSHVTLHLSTHTREAGTRTGSGPLAFAPINPLRGLTLKDVQIAYLAEKHYEASCNANGYQPKYRASKHQTPSTLEGLLSEWGKLIYALDDSNAETKAAKATSHIYHLTMGSLGLTKRVRQLQAETQ